MFKVDFLANPKTFRECKLGMFLEHSYGKFYQHSPNVCVNHSLIATKESLQIMHLTSGYPFVPITPIFCRPSLIHCIPGCFMFCLDQC